MIWYNDPGKCGDINPESLPLTKSTIDRLHKWAATFDSFLDWDDPHNSKKADEAFKQEGIKLLELLKEELGSEYEITLHNH